METKHFAQNDPVLDFDIYGLKIHSKGNNSVTYRKYLNDNYFVEVFNSRGVITIDLFEDDKRSVIASRYECLNQGELYYLLMRGRVKFAFPPK
jgi:hypothetical protein